VKEIEAVKSHLLEEINKKQEKNNDALAEVQKNLNELLEKVKMLTEQEKSVSEEAEEEEEEEKNEEGKEKNESKEVSKLERDGSKTNNLSIPIKGSRKGSNASHNNTN